VTYANAYALGPVQDKILEQLHNELAGAEPEVSLVAAHCVLYLLIICMHVLHRPGLVCFCLDRLWTWLELRP
jgi:hypothetical protein